MSIFSRLVTLFGAAIFLLAQTGHVTAFTGTWKLNVAKSSFNPGPPFQSFTLAFTPEGTRTLYLIGADGQPIKASLPWSDGKEVPVTGMANTAATSKTRGQMFDDTWTQNGKVIEKVHGVVSFDGRTLTITVDGTTSQRRTFENRLTFEKQ